MQHQSSPELGGALKSGDSLGRKQRLSPSKSLGNITQPHSFTLPNPNKKEVD